MTCKKALLTLGFSDDCSPSHVCAKDDHGVCLCVCVCVCVGGWVGVQESVMQRSRDLMSVFINRANGAWAEGCQWSTRSLHFAGGSVAEQQAFLQGDQWRVYRADLTRKLRNGQVTHYNHHKSSTLSFSLAIHTHTHTHTHTYKPTIHSTPMAEH